MDDSQEESTLTDQLAAAWKQQQPGETQDETDTSSEQTAAPKEETTEEETPAAEKPAEAKSEDAQSDDEATEKDLGVDESGKQYIPKSRFDKVYGKLKAYERGELQPKATAPALQAPQAQANQQPKDVDRTLQLEVEVMKGKLPQFDPESDGYDQSLDTLAFDIYTAGKDRGLTIMQAAKKAIGYQKELAQRITATKVEARTVKSNQSDQGITNRVLNREATELDPDKMKLEDMEAFLKQSGEWNKRS